MTCTVFNINNTTEYWKINLRKSSKGQNDKKRKKKWEKIREKIHSIKDTHNYGAPGWLSRLGVRLRLRS